MLIQLKQTEIEAALKMYIVSQGINLNNRTVDISFTSGRKDNGISADLDILDGELPSVSCAPTLDMLQPTLSTVIPQPAVPQVAAVPHAIASAVNPPFDTPDEIQEEEEPVSSKTSLFG